MDFNSKLEVSKMLLIVDNGVGSEEIARIVRIPHEVVKPNSAAGTKASGFILTDGDEKHKAANIEIINNSKVPVLAVGAGCAFLAEAFDSVVKKVPKVERMEMLKVERPGPLVVDMKRSFSVYDSYTWKIEEMTENFDVVARSPKYDFEIIMEMENPFFGIHFAPWKGGDGMTVLQNFVKFIEVWEKYHKGQ